MTKISRFLLAGAGCLALAGLAACEDNAGTAGWVDVDEAVTTPAAEPDQDAGERVSTREQHFDAFGYYLPFEPLQFGNWRLDNVFIAPSSDFEAWEAGGRRDEMPFGPVFVDFSDVNSPTGTNELGGEYHTVTTRVQADYYYLADGAFTFEGIDPELGTVIIDGALHGDVVRAGDSQRPAFTGGVEVGGERIRNISLRWYGGD
ncbi:hypothetical protein X907_2565 [Glycocaulis alkaliphilus]|uniref:Lipoprotein n=1 Tax=Glycocaulis alkaliphilus TaxID=1434191 RepID=A0A3T0ECP7_9PROT|nr:hypothetical protein [Glycocaulis alkaliphilus]AZU05077.1 hypothetical protein X907_2565 [Glycocaulis alkaliphilus]